MTVRVFSIACFLVVANVVHASDTRPKPGEPGVSVQQSGHDITLSNGFIQLTFDSLSHRMAHLSADHTGRGQFRVELLAPGGMEIQGDSGAAAAKARIVQRSPAQASVSLRWGPATRPVHLTFSLLEHERGVHVEAILPSGTGSIRLMLRQWFLLGIFHHGVVQYVAGQGQYFTSTNPLQLFYTIDRRNGSVALVPDETAAPREVSLLSGPTSVESGIILRPQVTQDVYNQWRKGTPAAAASRSDSKNSRIDFTLYANDLSYPAYRKDSCVADLSQAQARDIASYFTATYASAAGVLGSYLQPGSAYPTLAHPKRAYGGAFDFFDPDAWETVTTLAYSGDPLLQREAHWVLERSESAQLPDGQIPHHFVHGVPTFLSIAGSSQTGPNIFWTLAAINYAEATGDENWLRTNYPHLRMATDWVLANYSPRWKLVRANGPLFIDVFRRSGYTLDTNVFLYYLLKRMSGVAAFCNDPKTAKRYLAIRANLREGMLHNLWNGHDHFVTEREPDGAMRDFVDYDGNFAALAFGVLRNRADARKLLNRLDSGPHVHPGGYGTWVSERRYGRQDCYKGNTGDSDVAMARIWWLDMKARVQMGDIAAFNALFTKMENDLLQNVWLPERFDAEGRPTHNSYYHEYPEVFSMILRGMRYGIHISEQRVEINPFGIHNFSLNLGNLHVDYSTVRVSLMVPGSSQRTFVIRGLTPHGKYLLSTSKQLTADAHGTVRFTADAGKTLVITWRR